MAINSITMGFSLSNHPSCASRSSLEYLSQERSMWRISKAQEPLLETDSDPGSPVSLGRGACDTDLLRACGGGDVVRMAMWSVKLLRFRTAIFPWSSTPFWGESLSSPTRMTLRGTCGVPCFRGATHVSGGPRNDLLVGWMKSQSKAYTKFLVLQRRIGLSQKRKAWNHMEPRSQLLPNMRGHVSETGRN